MATIKNLTNGKTIEQKVLESYFDSEVEKVEYGTDYYINGHWYQVRDAEDFEDVEDEDEFGWIKNEPKYLFEDKYYYIIEQ